MRYIANIIAAKNSKISIDIPVKKCQSIEDTHLLLPTLIIGYENAKYTIKCFNILKKDYPEQNLYWTYSKTEKRCDYDSDVERFCNIAIQNIINKIKYQYVNVFSIGYANVKNILYFVSSITLKTMLYKDNNIFIFNKKENIIYGVSLEMCEYIGINTDKIIHKIKSNSANTIIDNISQLPYKVQNIIYDKEYYILPLYEYFNN